MDIQISIDKDKGSGATIVRLGSARVTYPLLPKLIEAVQAEVAQGVRLVALDLSSVTYIDSATIGCVMDIFRLLEDKGGKLHISAPQARVESMLSMAGVHRVVPIFREEEEALTAFKPAGDAK